MVESGWYFNWYIDACHSGGCKDETADWIKKNGGEIYDFDENHSICTFSYLDRDA